MSYTVDKAIFLRHYQGRAERVTDAEAEDAWRVYFMAQRAELFGDTMPAAEAEYLKREGKPAFQPNPRRRSLPGGHPHEHVLEVTVYTRPGGKVFAGALLENRSHKRHIELVSKDGGKLYRLSQASPLVAETLRSVGLRPSEMGFTELDAIVRSYSDDPQGFSLLAEKDEKTDSLEVMPRAAVLARWGPKGDRVARHL